MKKSFIFACVAAATMMFASCEKMDEVRAHDEAMDNTIKVNALIAGEGTKASAVETKTADVESFKMCAFNISASNDTTAVFGYTDFNKPTTGTAWTTGATHYWGDGIYKFYAAAIDGKATMSFTLQQKGIGTGTTGYEIKTDGKTNEPKWSTDKYVGGIYDSAVTSVSQPDPILASAETTKAASSADGVSMVFYHALSRVNLKLTSYVPGTERLKLVVVGYEFRNVGVKGSLNKLTEVGVDKITSAWSIETTGHVRENSVAIPATWTYGDGDSKSLIPTDSWCNVIPGTAANALVVKCALYDKTTGAKVADRYLAVAKGTSWVASYKAGYQYTYSVTINGKGGNKDTDKGGNPGIDDDDPDKGTHDGPDSNLGDLDIKVTSVTVTAWSSTTGGSATIG